MKQLKSRMSVDVMVTEQWGYDTMTHLNSCHNSHKISQLEGSQTKVGGRLIIEGIIWFLVGREMFSPKHPHWFWGPTSLPITECVLGNFPSEVMWPGQEADHSPHLTPRLRKSGATPPLPHMPFWHAQGYLYLSLQVESVMPSVSIYNHCCVSSV